MTSNTRGSEGHERATGEGNATSSEALAAPLRSLIPAREQAERVEGYRCPACDRAFYVQGTEEAYVCPTCRSERIWQMVGPFGVDAESQLATLTQERDEANRRVELLAAACRDAEGRKETAQGNYLHERMARMATEEQRDALVQALEWQPIETAPRDGVSVIGYGVKLPERWMRVGLGVVCSDGEWLWHLDLGWGPATHWKPLNPPAALASVEGQQ